MSKVDYCKDLYKRLFDHGLGDLPILQRNGDQVMLGYLVKDKGRLMFRDSGLLSEFHVENASGCWDNGMLGALTILENEEWECLSFVGAGRCVLPIDAGQGRKRLLSRIQVSPYSSLYDFRGSYYRAFLKLLDSTLLPVVLPTPVAIRGDGVGLAVADLKSAMLPVDALAGAHSMISSAIEKKSHFTVEEINLAPEKFDELFSGYGELAIG